MSDTRYLSDSRFEEVLAALSRDTTDGAAMGYMIMAAQALELEHETIRELERMMREKMDFYSAEHAERVYMRFA